MRYINPRTLLLGYFFTTNTICNILETWCHESCTLYTRLIHKALHVRNPATFVTKNHNHTTCAAKKRPPTKTAIKHTLPRNFVRIFSRVVYITTAHSVNIHRNGKIWNTKYDFSKSPASNAHFLTTYQNKNQFFSEKKTFCKKISDYLRH